MKYYKNLDIAKKSKTKFIYDEYRKSIVVRDKIFPYFKALLTKTFLINVPMLYLIPLELITFTQ